jgi:hypothetical protein
MAESKFSSLDNERQSGRLPFPFWVAFEKIQNKQGGTDSDKNRAHSYRANAPNGEK